jgi:hypothetical protein
MKYKNLRCISAILVFVVLISSGCSKNKDDESSKQTDRIQQILLERARTEVEDIEYVLINYSEDEDYGEYFNFLCKAGNKKYEGVAIICKNKIKVFDLAKIDTEAKFTVHTASGKILNDDKSEVLYFLCSGMVNDNTIKIIHIYLSDNSLREIRIGDNLAYNLVIPNAQYKILKIEALGSNGEIISTYS